LQNGESSNFAAVAKPAFPASPIQVVFAVGKTEAALIELSNHGVGVFEVLTGIEYKPFNRYSSALISSRLL
jgi:hypothetical protein